MCYRMCKMRVQRASEHGLGSIAQTVPKSIWLSEFTSEHTYARNAQARIRAMHVIGLLHREVVWHTSQSRHAIWCSPTCLHRDWRRDWLCDRGWPLGMGQWDIHIFLCRDQCLTHVWKWGIRTHITFTLEWFTNFVCLQLSICGWNMSTNVKRMRL